MVVVIRFEAAARVMTSLATSGVCCAAIAPAAAAIMLPEPMPEPIASELGWKIPRLAINPATIAMNSAPNRVPVRYSANTPRPSGESMP